MQQNFLLHYLKELMTTTWTGYAPEQCDICEKPITNEFYDTRTRSGRWGNLCQACWKRENGKLGTGVAQHYKRTADVWAKQ